MKFQQLAQCSTFNYVSSNFAGDFFPNNGCFGVVLQNIYELCPLDQVCVT